MKNSEQHYEGLAIRGHRLGMVVVHGSSVKFTPLSAGRSYQVKSARFAALRECWSWYRIVESVKL